MDFETEYQLEEFRKIQKDHFDEDGKAYKHYISTHLCEQMFLLINQLEKEVTKQAAAPDLLEACQTVVDGYETDGMENMEARDHVFYKYCKAALNKALGH